MVLIFFQWVLFCILTESYVSLQVWLMEADSSFFLTAVIFLLVGGAWEDQLSSPPVGCNNFSIMGHDFSLYLLLLIIIPIIIIPIMASAPDNNSLSSDQDTD